MRSKTFVFLALCMLATSASAGVIWESTLRFGQQPSRAGGELYYPSGVAVDSSNGEVYVADSLNQQIQRFTANGVFLNKWSFTAGIGLAVDPVDHSV